MDWKIWLIEHSTEIASLIVTIIGFWVAGKYLIKINNKQSINLINSPNSPIIQARGDVTSSNLDTFRKESKKEVAFSEETIEEDNPKKLISKIENYLDENKLVSTIAEMSLRLAKKLEMTEDEIWLEKEVQGYTEFLEPEEKNKGLKFKKQEERSEHRRIQAELNIGLKNGQIERFDIPMFISQPIRQIEDWASTYSNQNQIVMNAPPMELMVKNLNVDPRKDVPYLVSPSSFSRILNEVRLKIIEFLGQAKKKLNNSHLSRH